MKPHSGVHVDCGRGQLTAKRDGHQVGECAPVALVTHSAELPSAPVASSTDSAEPMRAMAAPPTESTEYRKALERLEAAMKEHETALRARANRLCRGHCDAEDVYQKAMLRALGAAEQIEDPRRTRAWLLQIITNTFIDQVREQRRRPPHEEFVDDISSSDLGEPSPGEDIIMESLLRAVDLLPTDTRDTLRMFALEGRSYAEISELQQIPIDTVGTRLHRARKQLRIRLQSMLRGSHGENKTRASISVHRRASAYLDGTLNANEEIVFLDHIVECKECQAELLFDLRP